MKRITVILLCILLCISIVGRTANNSSTTSSTTAAPTANASEATDKEWQSNTAKTNIESSETTGVSNESIAGTVDSSSTDKEVSSVTDRPSSSHESEKADTSKKPDTSTEEKKPETSAPTESEKKPNETKAQETKPQETTPSKDETQPPEESKPTEPEQPEDPYAYPFNISQIRQDCIAQGKSYGFKLDESLTPNNSSWSGAETANENAQGTRLKRFLSELVEYYSPAYRESMGLSEANITAFNIYVEDLGNGTYRIYFLFLL